ncbi:MAG: hypothetical protein ACKOXG_00350 [Arenimonas sp.]
MTERATRRSRLRASACDCGALAALHVLAGLQPCLTFDIERRPMDAADSIMGAVLAELAELRQEIARQEDALAAMRRTVLAQRLRGSADA